MGGPGNKRISVGRGNDRIWSGPGNDIIQAGNGNDWIYGGIGNDRIYAGTGNDHIFGVAGNNRIYAEGLEVHVNCGTGRHNLAYVTATAMRYARRHGCQQVRKIRAHVL